MPSTNTSNLNLEKPAEGEQSGEWGDTINSNMELIDAAVATKTGTETLTNKTLTSPVLATGVSGTAIKDEDDMASNSASHLATQQSIKAYVDSQTASEEEVEDIVGAMTIGNTETGIAVTYQDADGTIDFVVSDTIVSGDTGSTGITPGDTLTIAGGANITTAMSGDILTITGSVSGAIADLDIDGGTDIGEALVDADLFIVDNGANGTNRKSALSRLKTYVTADNTLTLYKFTATAAQTTFTGNDDAATSLAYTAGALFVTLNGSVLENGTDYTATTGTSIVLTDAATLSDELNVYAFGTFNVATVTGASGDFSVADDQSFTSDAAVVNFGVDSDVKITHVHDSGLTLKNTSTADDTPFVLLLQTGEIDIEAGDVLGKIQFQAPDEASGTDAILVAAEIAAVSQGDFAADNNATKLSFKTGNSEAATEKMALYASGNLELISADAGDAAGPTFTLSRDSATPAVSDSLGQVIFNGKNDAGEDVTYASITTSLLDETDGTEDGQLDLKVMRAGSSVSAIALKENEIELNAADIDINGDVTMTSAYTLNLSNIGTATLFKASGNIYTGRDSSSTYAEVEGAGYYTYYNADNYTRVLTYVTSGGSPVWQSRSAGATKSEIESDGDFQSANNSYGSVSDERLKEYIEDSGSQWDDVKAMRVRKYSFITDETDGPTQLGVIAQELEASGMTGLVKIKPYMDPPADGVGPDVPVLDADGNPTDYKTVKYSILYMKAVKALQEAMARIETLEAKVTALENA
jgi:hypothetical protein